MGNAEGVGHGMRLLIVNYQPIVFRRHVGLELGKHGMSGFLHVDGCKTRGISSLEFELYL